VRLRHDHPPKQIERAGKGISPGTGHPRQRGIVPEPIFVSPDPALSASSATMLASTPGTSAILRQLAAFLDHPGDGGDLCGAMAVP
jgi:hypothetical protein